MKRVLSLIFSLALLLSVAVSAAAAVGGVDANGNAIKESPVNGDAQWVSADDSSGLTVSGSVTGDSKQQHDSVFADSATIIVSEGSVSESGNKNAVNSSKNSTVTVKKGSVSESGDGHAVHTTSNAAVSVGGSVTEKDEGTAVFAVKSAVTVENGDVAESGAGYAVYAYDKSTVSVGGSVTEKDEGTAVYAGKNSTVTVGGPVSAEGNAAAADIYDRESGNDGKALSEDEAAKDEAAIIADNSAVTVKMGNVSETGAGNAIKAYNNAAVRVENGDVTESDGGHAIYAYNNSTVEVIGNVSEKGKDYRNAISAYNSSTVTVDGNVSGEGSGITDAAIRASGSTVKVSGDVTQNGGDATETAPEGQPVFAVSAQNASSVLIEGTASGNVDAYDTSTVYLGELNGTITANGSELVHYLFALTEKSLKMSDLTVVENSVLMVDSDIVEGISKTYTPTYSAAQLSSGPAAISVKAKQAGRELNFSGLPDTVKVTQENGIYTLTLTEDFKGGLTAVQILLKEIAHDNPDSGAEVYISTDILPFIFVDNGYLIETIEAEAPKGAEEAAVLPLEISNHAGIKVAPSLLIPTVEYHMVQLFLNNVPVPENAFSITRHADGSLSILMSNTYLLSLGSGTYNFRVLVDGQEIFFTAVVAK